MPILVAFYLFPYLLPVLPAYWLARRHGRSYHRSDWLAMLAPLGVYVSLEWLSTRQSLNALWATLLIGMIVAVCILFRGARLSAWCWAGLTSSIGALSALVAWLWMGDAPLALPLF